MVSVSLWCIFVAIVCNFGLGFSAVYHAALPEKPAEMKHLPGCYVKEVNNVIPFGEQATPVGVCYSIECSVSYLHYSTCGVVGTDDPKCYVAEEDLRLPYPNCCPTVKCDTNFL